MNTEQAPNQTVLPLHGGDIQTAAHRYGIAEHNWIDLSTGINPRPYPVGTLPEASFAQLPYQNSTFAAAVKKYYGHEDFVAVAGSQTAIQVLPRILDPVKQCSVLIPDLGYQEHREQWEAEGYSVALYHADSVETLFKSLTDALTHNPNQHVVIINPNNPVATLVEPEKIVQIGQLMGPAAYLVVDEAFIDLHPEKSLLQTQALAKNIVVMRSFGKFFGLAGIRLGFVFANPDILAALRAKLGIWQVNGPAQHIASQALADRPWQREARQALAINAEYTEYLFAPIINAYGGIKMYEGVFFRTYSLAKAKAYTLYETLAKLGILTRLIFQDGDTLLLRVGLVDRENTRITARLAAKLGQVLRDKEVPDERDYAQ